MVIDARLLTAQCRLLQSSELVEADFEKMLELPSMRAFLKHEEMLERETTAQTMRNAFETVIAGGVDCSSLNLSASRAETAFLLEIADDLRQNQERYIQIAIKRIARYTDAPLPQNTTFYLYALGGDGGFCPRGGEVYINLLKTRNEWMDVLCHELYHGRKQGAVAALRRDGYGRLPAQLDLRGDSLLAELAEEGIATLVQYDGRKMVWFDEVDALLRDLWRWSSLSKQERTRLKKELSSGPLRYAAAGFLADKVWQNCGRKGLESWSRQADLRMFRRALKDYSS